MPIIINIKICDNSRDCSGIEVCTPEALHWNNNKEIILIDETKCTLCGICENACPVGAIRLAKTQVEYELIKKEVNEDPRTISDLYVDLYGVEPMDNTFYISRDKFDIQVLKSTKLTAVELFNGYSLHCFIYSIPIKEIFSGIEVNYRKIEVKDNFLQKNYEIQELPALLFFFKGELVGKVEGYYDISSKQDLVNQVKMIVTKITS